ncbi:MAG: dTDP-4-dehydrorhamnose 3,5-epimerase [Cetobacterium sp.]
MLEGLKIIEPKIYGDERGFFYEFFNLKTLKEIGIEEEFLQGNHSKSSKGVLRGLHFQYKNSQGKLIRVLRGKILDVVVDLRKNSETFGKYYKIELTEENRKQIYIPRGFAHGFLTLEDNTEIEYLCTDYYNPSYEGGIRWNDKDLNIDWEFEKYQISESNLIISSKDLKQQFLKEFLNKGWEIE